MVAALCTALLWGLVEGVFCVLLSFREPELADQLISWEGGLAELDERLGFRAERDARVSAFLDGPNGRIYACEYTTDAVGRRVTPVENTANREQYAMFFGCSFTFGEGLNDDEALPAQFAREATEFAPYNYGFRAYGPQCMYLQVLEHGFAADIPQKRGLAIYTFINNHLDRLVGTIWVGTTWGRLLPYLTIENGQIVHHGNFDNGRPVTQFIYRSLRHLPSIQFLKINYPPVDADGTYRLLSRVCAATRDELRSKFQETTFVVVIYPHQFLGARLAPYVRAEDIACLDYRHLLDAQTGPGIKYYFEDGHPTAAAHAVVARQLAKDVQKLNHPPDAGT